MKASIYDLVYDYFRMFKVAATKERKANIYTQIYNLLRYKWTTEDIVAHLRKIQMTMPGVEPYQGNLLAYFSTMTKSAENLLAVETRYFHSELRLIPKAPIIDVDIDTGVITHEEEEYFMEPRASYSIKDLLNYYGSRIGAIETHQINRFTGSLEWLLDNFNIDQVLFGIDVLSNEILSGETSVPNSPTVLQDYMKAANRVMYEYITELIQNGGLDIVYKQRVPLD